jgi:hypothetical protein
VAPDILSVQPAVRVAPVPAYFSAAFYAAIVLRENLAAAKNDVS